MHLIGYGGWTFSTCQQCRGTGCVRDANGFSVSSCSMCDGTGVIRERAFPIYSNVPLPSIGYSTGPHLPISNATF